MGHAFAIILLLHYSVTFAKCDKYYLSLDFGGAIGDGAEIVKYLGQEGVPFTLFLVGKNSKSANGKKICEDIRKSKNKNISIGNHTISHEGFSPKHSEAHIREEILGNESYMNECDSRRVIKYFRYPKGSAHPIAEKILQEGGYLGTYKDFFPKSDAGPSMAVWWTTDTRDWVKSTGASPWAQIDYFNKNDKLLPVDKESWQELAGHMRKVNTNDSFNKKMSTLFANQSDEYPDFTFIPNISGYHGPSSDEISDNVLNDPGKLGRDGLRHCFPLMHYGGMNSFQALRKIIPNLKARGAEFRALGDGNTVHFQLKDSLRDLEVLSPEVSIICKDQDLQMYHTVKQGDTLYSIARSMINTNQTKCREDETSPVNKLVAKIIELNNITDTAEVNIGLKLRIPKSCQD